jgi:CBS domain-containing protein
MSPRAALRLASLGFTRVYDYIDGKVDWLAFALPTEGKNAKRLRAKDVLRADLPTCRLDETLGAVRKRVEDAGWDICAVVTETNVVLGLLRGKAWDADPNQPVEHAMSEGPSTIRPSEYLEDVTKRMKDRNVAALTVTTSTGHLLGLLVRKDAEEALGWGNDRGG